MRNKLFISLFAAILFSFQVEFSMGQQVAFPGAEGYGKYTTGGRGGRVVEVTNLSDKDRYGNIVPGSFRAAITTAGTDPITVVFRVSGIIELVSELKSSRSNMTIAGQTAPGDGICIKDNTVKLSGNNVIVRYIRFRPGDELKEQVSALNIENAKNIIVDHCSFSWAVEENATFYDNKYTTVQWCILSESLYNSYHSKGARGYAGQWGGQYASYHHNLIAHNVSRSPRINGSRAHDTVALLDFRNNVIFNWGNDGAIYGGEREIDSPVALCQTNLINNYYKPGPGTPGDLYFCRPTYVTDGNTAYGYGQWYLYGNYMEGDTKGLNANNVKGIKVDAVGNDTSNVKSDTIFEVSEVTTYTSHQAFDSVLAYAGATLPKRDTIDLRVIAEVRGNIQITGDGSLGADKGLIDSQTAVGGWPAYNTPSVDKIPVDTDKDGMPDEWETNNGLNPNDAEDGKTISEDGYSNLEHYLNSKIKYIKPEVSSLSGNEIRNFIVYPNPSNGLLTISSEFSPEKIELFDFTGKIVFSGVCENNSLNISNLNAGIYILKITNENGSGFQKITKN